MLAIGSIGRAFHGFYDSPMMQHNAQAPESPSTLSGLGSPCTLHGGGYAVDTAVDGTAQLIPVFFGR